MVRNSLPLSTVVDSERAARNPASIRTTGPISTATCRRVRIRYLLPREEQRILTRRHVAVLIGPVVLMLAGFLAALSLSTTVLSGNEFLTIAVWVGVAVLAARLIWKVANWLVDYFVVTSQRMLLTTGLLSRKVAMMPLSKVTDMSFRRSFAGRLLGYGEFIVESAGQDQALRTVDHLPYPEHLYLEVCGMLFPI